MYEKVPLVWFPCLREFYVRNFSIKNKLKTNSDPKLSIWPVKMVHPCTIIIIIMTTVKITIIKNDNHNHHHNHNNNN